MNEGQRAQWPASTSSSYPQMAAMPEDDFSTFLDLDTLDFDFPMQDENVLNGTIQQSNHIGDGTSATQDFAGFNHYETCPPTIPGQNHYMDGQMQSVITGNHQADYPTNMQDYTSQHWQAQHQLRPHMSIPPTPNSSDMYPTAYVQQMDPRTRHADQQAFNMLTPLTSPHFVHSIGSAAVHGYVLPTTQILSPLNSPAIYPQLDSMRGSTSVQSLTAESSVTGSPTEYDHDFDANDLLPGEPPRKTRRKASIAQLTKQPTAVVTRKRKAAAAAKLGSRAGTRNHSTDELKSPVLNEPPPAIASAARSYPSSASPQPQIQTTMRPPPKPLSTKSTPSIDPQSATGNTSGPVPPATPASLMRLASRQQAANSNDSPSGTQTANMSTDGLDLGMEELHLPEAAAAPSVPSSIQGTPRIASSVPSSTRATPALLPRISATSGTITSGMTPSSPFTNTSKNPNGRGGSRKRNSQSSNLVSPAIRPRISPNIRPMGSGDSSQSTSASAQTQMSDETHALLLASKSNYQNLLEGNTLPGVTYPSELSHNLTSKRTSHKLAEQGRRNRINTALQEMQALLPVSPGSESLSPNPGHERDRADRSSSKEKSGSGGEPKTPLTPAMQGANSKAATVELAIEHIRGLTGENERLKAEIDRLKRQVGEDGEESLCAKVNGSSPQAGRDITSLNSTLTTRAGAKAGKIGVR